MTKTTTEEHESLINRLKSSLGYTKPTPPTFHSYLPSESPLIQREIPKPTTPSFAVEINTGEENKEQDFSLRRDVLNKTLIRSVKKFLNGAMETAMKEEEEQAKQGRSFDCYQHIIDNHFAEDLQVA